MLFAELKEGLLRNTWVTIENTVVADSEDALPAHYGISRMRSFANASKSPLNEHVFNTPKRLNCFENNEKEVWTGTENVSKKLVGSRGRIINSLT